MQCDALCSYFVISFTYTYVMHNYVYLWYLHNSHALSTVITYISSLYYLITVCSLCDWNGCDTIFTILYRIHCKLNEMHVFR